MINIMNQIDWGDILTHLESLATCELSREHIRQISPLTSPEEAKKSFGQIEEAERVLLEGKRPAMESLDLFSSWYERLKRDAVLKSIELKDVRHFLSEVLEARNSIQTIQGEWLQELFSSFVDPTGPISAIDQLLTPGGDIRTDASEELFALFKEKQDKERQLQNTLDKIVKKNQMDNILQDRYVTNRQGRWVVPVKSGMQHDLKGIIHDQSHTKQTVFIEPEEVVATNNLLIRVENEIEREIERLLTQLSKYLGKSVQAFEISKKLLLNLDTRLAEAQLS